jgi:integral membrane protein (TIGR01906 family)
MSVEKKRSFLPGWVVIILRIILVAALPLVLVLVNARVLMSGAFLQWEYNRPNFSPDPFGFTVQDRLAYAPLALDYLFNDQGTDFLGKQTKPDGSPVYNERELSHMDDVKGVVQELTRFGLTLVGVYILSLVLMSISAGSRPALYRSLFWGGIATVVVIVLALVITATSFEWLFTEFHRLFFTGNTWIFPTSDTLIRLFPEQFWVDAFALMFGGAMLEAIILGGVMWRLNRRKPRAVA